MKIILGAVAAAVMVGMTFVQPADARCFWNGFETVCVHHRYMDMERPYFHSYRDYRDWDRY